MKHMIHSAISSSSHRISIDLVGVGGTGSHVLMNLAMISNALTQIDRQPLHVISFDPDIVSESNINRQVFSPADIGDYKAKVLTERINRYYGFEWDFYPELYPTYRNEPLGPDIIISAVDTISVRKQIEESWHMRRSARYWLDIGNNRRIAQIILGSDPEGAGKQKKGFRNKLPHFFEEFPDIKDTDDDGPSCSAWESLNKQDLFINKIIATYATHMLWQLLVDFIIDYRGMYINLETMKVSKIPI